MCPVRSRSDLLLGRRTATFAFGSQRHFHDVREESSLLLTPDVSLQRSEAALRAISGLPGFINSSAVHPAICAREWGTGISSALLDRSYLETASGDKFEPMLHAVQFI